MHFHLRGVGCYGAVACCEDAILQTAGQCLHTLLLLVGIQPKGVGILDFVLVEIHLLLGQFHGAVSRECGHTIHTVGEAVDEEFGVHEGGVALTRGLLVEGGNDLLLVHFADAKACGVSLFLLAFVGSEGGIVAHTLDCHGEELGLHAFALHEIILEALGLGHADGIAVILGRNGLNGVDKLEFLLARTCRAVYADEGNEGEDEDGFQFHGDLIV